MSCQCFVVERRLLAGKDLNSVASLNLITKFYKGSDFIFIVIVSSNNGGKNFDNGFDEPLYTSP